MRVRFLGTGTLGTQRRCTSFLVNDNILFEIGNGTVAGLLENNLDVKNISIIVISHFHGDHYGDIVYFLHRRAMQELIDQPLVIVGPKGLQKKIIEFNNLLFGDIRDHSEIAEMWNIRFIELGDSGVLVSDEFEIEAFKVLHGKLDANGYIVRYGNKTLGYTGDACLTDGVMARIREAKTWIMEANEMMRKEGLHIGFSELIGLADMYPKIDFYAVHRKDYDMSKNIQVNLIAPIDGDEIILK